MKLEELYSLLGNKLAAIWDDYEFVIGVLSDLDTEEEVQRVIDYIDAGIDVDPSSIVCFSTEIHLSKSEAQ